MPRFIFGDSVDATLRVKELLENGGHHHDPSCRSGISNGSSFHSSVGVGYRSPYRTSNGYVAYNVNRNPITSNKEVHPLSVYPHSLHHRNYLPRHRNEQLVYSSVHWKWRTNQGKQLDKGLMMVVKDEMEHPKTGVTRKNQRINLELLASLFWSLVAFVYTSRFLKTRAEALVKYIFQVIVEKHLKAFRDVLLHESCMFI
jgi:hypothetical protein